MSRNESDGRRHAACSRGGESDTKIRLLSETISLENCTERMASSWLSLALRAVLADFAIIIIL